MNFLLRFILVIFSFVLCWQASKLFYLQNLATVKKQTLTDEPTRPALFQSHPDRVRSRTPHYLYALREGSGESGYLLSALQVPKPQRSVHRSRDGTAAVGRHRHGPDPVRMAFERADRLTALQVPEPQRSILRSRNGTAAVGRHRHGPDPVRMAFERADRLAALQVPEPQRSILRARHHSAPVGRDRHGKNPVLMPFEGA